MTKKDYVKAAQIVALHWKTGEKTRSHEFLAQEIENAFVQLFEDIPRFDEVKFRRACQPKTK